MPETPDFERLAEEWCYREDSSDVSDIDGMRAEFVAMLRDVWNARGAADIATLEASAAGNAVELLGNALRSLDR